MIALRVATDLGALQKRLGAQLSRRLPSVLAQAMTKTAFDARDAVRRTMPDRFTLRRPWVVQGVQAQGATPGRLKAVVGSRDAFMVWQETGGLRVGKNAIPLGPLAQQAKTQVIPKRLWPKALLKGRGAFVRRGIVFVRQGKAVQPMWKLVRAQAVRPRFGMRETVEKTVAESLPRRFARAWAGDR